MNISRSLDVCKPLVCRILLTFFIIFSFGLQASDTEHSTPVKEDGPDVTKFIFEHILDSHDWHLWGEHEHAVSIPLPIILYSNTNGLVTFLSSKFHHGKESYGVYYIENEKIKSTDPLETTLVDLSITKNIACLIIMSVIVLFIFLGIASSYKKNQNGVPRGVQSFFEPLVIFVRDEIAKPNIGAKYEKFLPYLLTVFFLIWFLNIFGLIPVLSPNVTGNPAFTVVLAGLTFFATNAFANKAYWGHILMPPVPKPLWILLVPLEIMGIFIKPVALMVRLAANITAGHIVVISMISLIFIMKTLFVSPVGIGMALFINVLEVLVAFLQAYIFTMLSALFIGQANESHSHDSEHGHAH